MRKSTFLLMFMFSVLFSIGQNPTVFQKKFDAAKEKYTRMLSPLQATHSNLSPTQQKWIFPSEILLKSTVASMKLDSTVSKTWNELAGEWQNDMKDEYHYDDEMRNTMWLYSDWNDETDSWEAWSKTEVEYNADGTVGTMLTYESSLESSELKLINKMLAFYDETGRLDSVQHWYTEDQQTWNLEGKQHYSYDNSGKLTEMKMWALEEDEGEEFMSVMRYVFSYNEAGRMETSSMFFQIEGEEMLFFKTNYHYGGDGKLDYTEDWSLSFMSFQLEKSSKTEFSYSNSGDLQSEIYSEWDAASETWIPDSKDEYTYNNFNYSEVYFPSYLLFWGIVEETPVSGKAIAEIETMEWMEGTSKVTDKTIFYYSEGTNTFADKPVNVNFSVFPNPVSEKVTFNWSGNQSELSLEIYQLTGSRVLEKTVNSGQPVSLAGMENGIYLFKLKNGKQSIHTGKLVKK